MSLSIIRLTEFHVEKLQCIGGQGRSAPYRITVYDGLSLGEIGLVADLMFEVADCVFEAANHDNFEQQGPIGFKRLLNMIGM